MKKVQREKEAETMEAAALRGVAIPGKELPEPFDFDSFKFNKVEDFEEYNKHVRKHNRYCLHERNKMHVKIPDASYYKTYKVKFHKMQQPENVQKIRVRNKDIDWKGELKSGGTYDLPKPVIKFLSELSIPEFAEVKSEHGSATHSETKQVGEIPRFSCSIVDFD